MRARAAMPICWKSSCTAIVMYLKVVCLNSSQIQLLLGLAGKVAHDWTLGLHGPGLGVSSRADVPLSHQHIFAFH